MPNIDYELPNTVAAHEFFNRRPAFPDALDALLKVCNKTFGREKNFSSQLDEVVFESGQSCRGDYAEIVFLCVGGHGIAALKLVRGLYERALTLAYLLKHPEKVERFIYFAALPEYTLMQEALALFSEEEIEKTTNVKIADVKVSFQKALAFFGGKKPWHWDMPLVDMVKDVGGAYQNYYLPAYLLPTSNMHASLASVMRSRANTVREADVALALAHVLLLLVLKNQNTHFTLQLEADIDKAEALSNAVWKKELKVTV